MFFPGWQVTLCSLTIVSIVWTKMCGYGKFFHEISLGDLRLVCLFRADVSCFLRHVSLLMCFHSGPVKSSSACGQDPSKCTSIHHAFETDFDVRVYVVLLQVKRFDDGPCGNGCER